MKTIKQLLRERDFLIGLSIWHVCEPWVAKVYADAGADFVFMDNEHIMFDGAKLAGLVLSCQMMELPVVAKCPYWDRGYVTRLLDAGVLGIQLPMTETKEQVEELISWCKFPPIGKRAAGPGIGNSNYRSIKGKQWMDISNESTSIIAHIESRKGIENADKIMSMPHVDAVFIGLLDLSIDLGCPMSFDNQEMLESIDHIINTAKRYGKCAGMCAGKFEIAEQWLKKGVRMFEMRSEVQMISESASNTVNRFPNRKAIE